MTLPELCEPVFQYVCRLNRSARKGGSFEQATVRNEVRNLLAEMRASAADDQALREQYDLVELPLIFFLDSMISEGGLNISDAWNAQRLAYERNELAGDEKFFDLLEETLADSKQAASERLVIFYTCIGLGFTGWYAGQQDYLRKRMKDIASRIKAHMSLDEGSRICAEAYDHVDTRDLIEPPSHKLVGIAIGLVGLIVVLFVTNIYLYRDASAGLSKALRQIIAYGEAPTPGAAASDGRAER
jgi:type IV/VI secretion system ImpK/VasF family protein